MSDHSESTLKHQNKLRQHYQKNFEAAVEALNDDLPVPLEEFCWMALSWRTCQMVADIGAAETASMFEQWARLIRDGRFGEFDGRNMSKFSNFDESLIY